MFLTKQDNIIHIIHALQKNSNIPLRGLMELLQFHDVVERRFFVAFSLAKGVLLEAAMERV
jgi:hypothetical protein